MGRSAVSVAELAKEASFSRMTIYRYLTTDRKRKREPKPYDVLSLNKAMQSLVAGKGTIPGNVDVFTYLNVTAALDGLLDAQSFTHEGPVSLDFVLDGAIQTLQTLGSGLLHPDWYSRLIDAAKSWNPSQFLIELNREHGRLLIDAVDGRVPARKGYEALRALLVKHNVRNLLDDDPEAADGYEELVRDIRKVVAEIAAPDLAASDRFTAERRIMDSVYRFALQVKQSRSYYEAALESFGPKNDETPKIRSKRR
jgi:hypothetical protein